MNFWIRSQDDKAITNGEVIIFMDAYAGKGISIRMHNTACSVSSESIVLGDGYSYDEAIGILGDILAGQNKDFYYMPLPSGSCS